MPKVVDHARRRDDIAFAACKAVARFGFDRLTLSRIAREAGCTTGMIAHYFETKQDIILAALRLISSRMETRLTKHLGGAAAGETSLAEILGEALPIDAQRRIETTVWIGFWSHVASDPAIREINMTVHEEWTDLIRRCVLAGWPELRDRPETTRQAVCRSIHIFVNGLTASAATSPHDWPPEDQMTYLRDHLERLRRTV